jgi:uncharacterized protein YbaR (Trm112 family)
MVMTTFPCSECAHNNGEAMSDNTKNTEPAREVDPKLLEILVCPLTRATLHYDRTRQELISRPARLAYPIRDGIPIMLPEEARALGEDELK